MSKTSKLFHLFIMVSVLLIAAWTVGNVFASELVPQTWLPGDSLFGTIGFTQPLPIFGPGYNAALPRVNALMHPFLKVTMKETAQPVLPGYPPTRVWAYETSDAITGKVLGPAHWPAVTVEAQRFVPTWLKYINELPSFGDPIMINGTPATGLVQGLVTNDQSIHWADPLRNTGPMNCMDMSMPGMSMPVDCTNPANSNNPCCQVFSGPVPAVVHLHGAEAFSGVDGGPEQWFTPNGLKGKDFFSYGHPGPGEAIYVYDNLQEPGTLWFHDHALGATRTNVYSGLATFYFLRGPLTEPRNLPKGAYEIEMAIQDRQFDTNGQIFFPDGSPSGTDPSGVCGSGLAGDPCLNGAPPNPDIHPFWNPEFFGDVVIVNGTPWPVLQVEPRRYLFRILDGSNARTYRLGFGDSAKGEPSPPVYVIGMDDNYLDAPVNVTGKTVVTKGESWPDNTVLPAELFIAPGERNYVIVDFSGLAGKTITLVNNASAPFPSGLVPGVDAAQLNMNKIMQFKVSLPLVGKTDTSCNPAIGGCKRPISMVRLANGNGAKAPGVKIDKVRQLVLKEHEGPGGPVEVLVNNTHWDGLMSPSIAPYFPVDGVSELPRVGSTELWEIINLTMDAHPMHTHLTQFQVLNREDFQGDLMTLTGGYFDAWGAAFGYPNTLPLSCTDPTNAQNPCPGYGPPLPYTALNGDNALGGNPAIGPFLLGNPTPPDPEEAGWKDTAKAYPGKVTRFLVRWTPTSIPNLLAKPGRNLYTFDPTKGPGYVWHCHIIDHEDNEMMRPYKVTK
jgi:spore coat protein A